jgi:hypothetical protein
MIKFLNQFFHFWAKGEFASPLRIFLLCFLGQIITITYLYDRFPPEIPLFLARQWGTARLAPLNNVYLFPILSIAIMVTNTLLASLIRAGNVTLSKLLLHFGAMASILFLVAEINLIFLVT